MRDQTQIIMDLRQQAHRIDLRINLFEGYTPIRTDGYSGELLYWRQLMNLYGLFADCDRVQIKQRDNLFTLMNRYSLIERDELDAVVRFWNNLSCVRAWFCHNNDAQLQCTQNNNEAIEAYLRSAYVMSSNTPNSIEGVRKRDWDDKLISDMDRRFDEYIRILRKGLGAWERSDCKEELIDEWINSLSGALALSRELIQNVVYEIAEYNKLDQDIRMSAKKLSDYYYKQLIHDDKLIDYINEELHHEPITHRSNKQILYDCIDRYGLVG